MGLVPTAPPLAVAKPNVFVEFVPTPWWAETLKIKIPANRGQGTLGSINITVQLRQRETLYDLQVRWGGNSPPPTLGGVYNYNLDTPVARDQRGPYGVTKNISVYASGQTAPGVYKAQVSIITSWGDTGQTRTWSSVVYTAPFTIEREETPTPTPTPTPDPTPTPTPSIPITPNAVSSSETEIAPRTYITDYLRPPIQHRPIERKGIKRSFMATDSTSIAEMGRLERRFLVSSIDSWGGLQQIAEDQLKRAAECVVAQVEVPCNPLIAPGDTVNLNTFGEVRTYRTERVVHNLAQWLSTLTLRRIPLGDELKSAGSGITDEAETAIVQTIKKATARVDNAKEATIVERVDDITYKVRVLGQTELITVTVDRSKVGDLLVGSTVLIGRGTE